ncbi:MAG: hypothetical protein ABJG78_15110 [Cyclobacteriaceae bacterium]
MKKYLTLALSIAIAMPLLAQLPRTLSFQGYLTNDTGEPITTEAGSPLDVSFSLYTTKALGTGTLTWGPEDHEVQVDKGIFDTILGASEVTAVPLDFSGTLSFNNPYFLQITINRGTPQEEVLPRIELTSGMYSLSTVNASNITSGTLSGSLLDQVDATIISGTVDIANGGTGATTPTNARANLGVRIGSDVQAHDAYLDDLADGTLSASIVIQGFTTLGDVNAPSVKMKVVTGTTIDNAAGGLATISHGIADHLDILSVSIFIENSSGSLVPPNISLVASNFFYYVIDATNINVVTTATSADLRNRAITATIVYRQ